MRAAVLEAYGEPLRIEERERPDPAPHGAVVGVAACGICRSDWHAWRGHGEWADDRVPLGQVLGHEPAGRVVAVGERVASLAAGDRVAVPFNLGDGNCPYCREGNGNVCPNGRALGFESAAPGAFAEFVHVPHADYNAASLPDGVSSRDAAALGCRYATAYNALARRGGVAGGDWVAVFGCGGLGLSAVQIADALGANVVAVDVREAALRVTRDLGARATVDAAGDGETAAAVRAATDGGAHVALDALGSRETCRAGVASLRRRGVHVQAGLTGADERGEIDLPTDVMARREIDFRGVRGMPPTRYDALFGLLSGGDLDPGALVTREVALDDVSARLAAMDEYATTGVEVVTEFG